MTGCNLSALLTEGSGEGADLVGAVAQGALPAPRVAVTGRHAAGHGLALELSPVRVNTVSPGLIATPLWSKLDAEAAKAAAKTDNDKKAA